MISPRDDDNDDTSYEDEEEAEQENPSDGGFDLSAALAIATANEREKRRRAILANELVETVYGVFATDCSGDGKEADDSAKDSKQEEQRKLAETLVSQEKGSAPIAGIPVSWNGPNSKTTWKSTKVMHWYWQTSGEGTKDVVSTCNLSLLASDGVKVELFAPSNNDNNNDNTSPVAVFETTNLQWTLEGTTNTNCTTNDDLENQNLRSFWKIDRATLSCATAATGDVVAEEVLMEGSEISLLGTLIAEKRTHRLALCSESVLSLTISSIVGSLSGTDEEKKRVGLALRTAVRYLDTIVSTPNLNLVLQATAADPDNDDVPSLEKSGESSMTLGDALKYYLKYYCSTPKTAATAQRLPSRFLSMGDSVATFGALAATGTSMISPLGAAVSVAALAAKDGVAAAARKGKEARMNKQQDDPRPEAGSGFANRISLSFGSSSSALSSSNATATAIEGDPTETKDGYKFGDVTRGLIGSIRGNRNQSETTTSEKTDYLAENKGRFAGVAGGTAGAAAGMVIAGPVGALAGSMLGSLGSQRAVQKHEQEQQLQQEGAADSKVGDGVRAIAARGKEADGRDPASEFRIGDFSRGLIAKGKEATGRAKSEGYRFGDFSRGLFAAVQGTNTANQTDGVETDNGT